MAEKKLRDGDYWVATSNDSGDKFVVELYFDRYRVVWSVYTVGNERAYPLSDFTLIRRIRL